MASPLLSLRSIFKSYRGMDLLRGIDFDANPGEFFTLLGAPGCGNSTTVSLIAGYSLPDRGQIILGDRLITHLAVEKRRIGVVHPEVSNKNKTAVQYIAEGLRAHGTGRRDAESRANELLKKTGLDSIGSQRLRNLSGWNLLAAAILREAAPSPEILLLEDPLSYLDYTEHRTAKSDIRLLHRKLGITFVCSMENADDALAISDRIALMREGRVVQEDTPHKMYNYPQTEYAATYLGGANLIRGSVSATGNGRSILNVDGLSLPCEYDEPLAFDQKMCLCIYAERLSFGAHQNGEIHLNGIVRENRFEGGMRRTLMELPTGQTLAALKPSHEPNEFMPGQRVFIWWDIKDAVLVEDGS